nr:MAG TPA: hypothetical protein [Caudoviricetes sp.]
MKSPKIIPLFIRFHTCKSPGKPYICLVFRHRKEVWW